MEYRNLTPPVIDYFCGLDLAQAADYSALAVAEKHTPRRESGKVHKPPKYVVSFLHRWPRGTSYPTIARDVGKLLDTPHSKTGQKILRGCTMAVDVTGVGQGVFDLMAESNLPCQLRSVLITGGHAVSPVDGGWNIAKVQLVSTLQAALQSDRLEVPATLSQADVLRKEFANFRVKVTAAGNETFEAWRERDHDDLVLAVALALFLADRHVRAQPPRALGAGPRLGSPVGGPSVLFGGSPLGR